MRHILINIFISLLFVANIYSKENIKFHTLTPKGGLSYDGIMDISQDTSGFVWIALENNIFRFDGYTYKSYKHAFQKNGLEDISSLNNITTDIDGNLYVSSGNGIYKFDFLSERFDLITEINNNYIYADKSNLKWILSSNDVHSFDNNGNVNHIEFSGRQLPLHNKMIAESDNDLFFFSRYGHIYKYNSQSNVIDDFANINDLFDVSSLIQAQVRDNILWIINSNLSIIKLNATSGDVISIHKNDEYKNLGVRCGYISEDGKAWVGTMNGLLIIDPDKNNVVLHQNNQNNKFTIPHNSVWTISEDNYHNIWIGTYVGSAAYVNKYEENIFTTYQLSTEGLMKTPVSGFSVHDEKVWISTEGGGVNILNKKNDSFSYLTRSDNKDGLSGNYTKPSAIDKEGNIWIPTFREGLNKYNPKTKQFINIRYSSNNASSLLSNDLRKVILEPDSGLWIIYQLHSLKISYLSFDNMKVTHFSAETDDFNISPQDYIFDAYRGDDDKLWFITSEKLFEFDINNKTFKLHSIPSQKGLSASTLCMDDDNTIWIGTFGNELIKFDTRNKSFTSYPDILKSDIAEIYSINWSNNGIWMGANDGLYLFDKNSYKTSIFKESDGTQGDVYYRLSTFKDDNGRLYFGGTGGFTIIEPNIININPIEPNTIVSDFYLDYKPVQDINNLKISIDTNNSATIRLNHNQQNFGLKISSDNYLNSDKNQYKYRLRNYDKQWISTDAQNRIIHYSKIPAGTYYFEFQSANNDGVWGKVSSIKIIRKPAPWASTMAWIIYLIVFMSLLYYLISTYRNKKKLENQLYFDKLEKEKREEIHKNQFLFFTNVSHDLKTPLALIMATINSMREEGMKEYYYKILNSNSQRLMLLLNDILDFRNLQKNKIKLAVREGDINEFISKIATDFNELAIEKRFKYNVVLGDESLSNIPFDTNIMEKIALNLFNNAFKYTDKGGEIRILVTRDNFVPQYKASHSIINNVDFNRDNSFKLIVSDTGVGISEESISKVFERFYKVDTKNENKHLGTGIGLALVKELVSIHKANISIYSERDKGTDFILQFSSSTHYYSADEYIKESFDDNEETTDILNEVVIVTDKSNKEESDKLTTKLSTQEEQTNKTLIIAEDNDDLRGLLKSSLSSIYKVVDFNDAKPAIEYLKSNDADMIISDIMMPEIDGITFCKLMKNNVETSHIPFILLTAKSGVESQLEGTESGADLYFEKPTDLNLLKAAISNIFKQQELLRNHYASNYFADVSEIATNREDDKFLKDVTGIIDSYLDKSELDVNTIATEMMMSRSKLYSKIKSLTGKSIVEFILNYRLRKAAKLLIENNITIQEAMYSVGIESRSYFTNSFKKEFGMTPSKFIEKNSAK